MNPSSKKSLVITSITILIGLSYFLYISAASFPHDIARIIPFIWLASAIYSFKMGLSAFHQTVGFTKYLFYILAIVNILFACIFSMGALMGD